jgi:hypothetical protein
MEQPTEAELLLLLLAQFLIALHQHVVLVTVRPTVTEAAIVVANPEPGQS